MSRAPHLAAYMEYVKAVGGIRPEEVLKELSVLENDLLERLCARPDELRLIRAEQSVERVTKLLDLRLAPDEFLAFQRERAAFSIEEITGFLNEKIMQAGKHYEKALYLKEGYADIIRRAARFYELTLERDDRFVRETLARMDGAGEAESVLITGGYHTPNLKRLLRERGVSYVSVIPQVLHETDLAGYERKLLGQPTQALKTASGLRSPVLKAGALRLLEQRLLWEVPGSPIGDLSRELAEFRGSAVEAPADEAAAVGVRMSLNDGEKKRLEPAYRDFGAFVRAILDEHGSFDAWKRANPQSRIMVFARHGEAISNVLGFSVANDTLAPLTLRGIRQKRALTRMLTKSGVPFQIVLSSDLERAYRTVEPAARAIGQAPVIRTELREASPFPEGGHPRSMFAGFREKIYNDLFADPQNFRLGNFSVAQIRREIDELMFEKVPSDYNQIILAGTHGRVLEWILTEALRLPPASFEEVTRILGGFANAGLTVMEWNGSAWRLLVSNDNSYLPENLRRPTRGALMRQVEKARYAIKARWRRWVRGMNPGYLAIFNDVLAPAAYFRPVSQAEFARRMARIQAGPGRPAGQGLPDFDHKAARLFEGFFGASAGTAREFLGLDSDEPILEYDRRELSVFPQESFKRFTRPVRLVHSHRIQTKRGVQRFLTKHYVYPWFVTRGSFYGAALERQAVFLPWVGRPLLRAWLNRAMEREVIDAGIAHSLDVGPRTAAIPLGIGTGIIVEELEGWTSLADARPGESEEGLLLARRLGEALRRLHQHDPPVLYDELKANHIFWKRDPGGDIRVCFVDYGYPGYLHHRLSLQLGESLSLIASEANVSELEIFRVYQEGYTGDSSGENAGSRLSGRDPARLLRRTLNLAKAVRRQADTEGPRQMVLYAGILVKDIERFLDTSRNADGTVFLRSAFRNSVEWQDDFGDILKLAGRHGNGFPESSRRRMLRAGAVLYDAQLACLAGMGVPVNTDLPGVEVPGVPGFRTLYHLTLFLYALNGEDGTLTAAHRIRMFPNMELDGLRNYHSMRQAFEAEIAGPVLEGNDIAPEALSDPEDLSEWVLTRQAQEVANLSRLLADPVENMTAADMLVEGYPALIRLVRDAFGGLDLGSARWSRQVWRLAEMTHLVKERLSREIAAAPRSGLNGYARLIEDMALEFGRLGDAVPEQIRKTVGEEGELRLAQQMELTRLVLNASAYSLDQGSRMSTAIRELLEGRHISLVIAEQFIDTRFGDNRLMEQEVHRPYKRFHIESVEISREVTDKSGYQVQWDNEYRSGNICLTVRVHPLRFNAEAFAGEFETFEVAGVGRMVIAYHKNGEFSDWNLAKNRFVDETRAALGARLVDWEGETYDLEDVRAYPADPRHLIIHPLRDYDPDASAEGGIRALLGLFGRERALQIGTDPASDERMHVSYLSARDAPVYLQRTSALDFADFEEEAASPRLARSIEASDEIILTGGYAGACHLDWFRLVLSFRLARGLKTTVYIPRSAVYASSPVIADSLRGESFIRSDYAKALRLPFSNDILKEDRYVSGALPAAVFDEGQLVWKNSDRPAVVIHLCDEIRTNLPVSGSRTPEQSLTEAVKRLREHYNANIMALVDHLPEGENREIIGGALRQMKRSCEQFLSPTHALGGDAGALDADAREVDRYIGAIVPGGIPIEVHATFLLFRIDLTRVRVELQAYLVQTNDAEDAGAESDDSEFRNEIDDLLETLRANSPLVRRVGIADALQFMFQTLSPSAAAQVGVTPESVRYYLQENEKLPEVVASYPSLQAFGRLVTALAVLSESKRYRVIEYIRHAGSGSRVTEERFTEPEALEARIGELEGRQQVFEVGFEEGIYTLRLREGGRFEEDNDWWDRPSWELYEGDTVTGTWDLDTVQPRLQKALNGSFDRLEDADALVVGSNCFFNAPPRLLEDFPRLRKVTLIDTDYRNIAEHIGRWTRLPEPVRSRISIVRDDFLKHSPERPYALIYANGVVRSEIFEQRLSELWGKFHADLVQGGALVGAGSFHDLDVPRDGSVKSLFEKAAFEVYLKTP
ncbi:MAG: histidine phosphatase family protein, partial [Candidatus Omnitrophica bacterium]|nr:histidine phosphatase family protein [Candidatus Omnitrophota bacterium]